MTVDTRDILLKAAEDVQSGMWCGGARFSHSRTKQFVAGDPFTSTFWIDASVDDLVDKYRCAEGSIILAARLLGGDLADANAAIEAVEAVGLEGGHTLWGYNDIVLSIRNNSDPFEAGQQLATLFRETAESL